MDEGLSLIAALRISIKLIAGTHPFIFILMELDLIRYIISCHASEPL